MSIVIHYSDPLWFSQRTGYSHLVESPESYNDMTDVKGGYLNASFSVAANIVEIEDWLEKGIGRHIEVYTKHQRQRWEGFVNSIVASIGPLSITYGPLIEVTNKSALDYTDFTTGVSSTTTTANDTTSQGLYGIWHKILNGDRMSSTIAGNIRDTYIKEKKYPNAVPTLSSSANQVNLQINCLGYIHMMKYPYNNTGVSETATQTAKQKIEAIINADPNSIFNLDTNQIAENTLSVFSYEDENKPGYDLIKSLVAMGDDTSNNRMLFGVYNNLTPVYEEIPDSVEYYQKLSRPGLEIKTADENTVDSWDIVPGKWIQLQDFLIGREIPQSSLREDMRIIFAESVSFDMNEEVTIAGGIAAQLPQKLAKLGIGGI